MFSKFRMHHFRVCYKVNEGNSRFTGIRQRGKFEKFKPTNGERESVTTDTMATENIIITKTAKLCMKLDAITLNEPQMRVYKP